MDLQRTYATSLTDDELLILDPLFRFSSSLRCLFRDGFCANWNLESHQLDDAQVRSFVEEYTKRGWLTFSDDDKVALTPLGGRCWESERLPPWDRYVDWGGRAFLNDDEWVKLYGTSWKVLSDYCASERKSGILKDVDVSMRTFAVRSGGKHSLIYWKTFPHLCYVVATLGNREKWNRLVGEYEGHEYWDAVESERTWWSDLNGLRKFRLRED